MSICGGPSPTVELLLPDGGEEVEWAAKRFVETVQADDLATEALRQAERAVGVAVGHEHRAGALVGQRAREQLARLAGAEDHDVTVGQVAEHAEREFDRDRGQAHAL